VQLFNIVSFATEPQMPAGEHSRGKKEPASTNKDDLSWFDCIEGCLGESQLQNSNMQSVTGQEGQEREGQGGEKAQKGQNR
jgi:hypothetical protein